MSQRLIGYVRVSTDKQADHGVSLEAQRVKLEQYCALYDLTLVDIIVDAGESAKTLKRPGLQRALALLASGEADGLLVAKLDRLTRSVRDLGELLERYFTSAALLSVADQIDTSTAAGRLVLNVLMSVSQWEREAISERTKTAMAHKKSQGQRVGAIPYGFTLAEDGSTLLPDAAEQAMVAQMTTAHARGLSLRAIAAELARQGLLNRQGNIFSPTQIARILKAEAAA
jgi:site-specific DNA recombinase